VKIIFRTIAPGINPETPIALILAFNLKEYHMTTELMEKPETQSTFEVLTMEEFMERMKISRSTVLDWKKKGHLKPGKHYIQKGHVIRYLWAKDVVLDLCDPEIMKVGPIKKIPAVKRVPRKSPAIGVNLDY
jgi:hypothetical protein